MAPDATLFFTVPSLEHGATPLRKLSACLTALFALVSLASAASADTLKLVSTGGQVVDNVYVYPYNFSINSASGLTSLLCMDYNREVTVNEQWNVSINKIGVDSSALSTQYREAAYLYSQLGSNSNSDVQFAAWDIFDDADVKGLSGFTSNASTLVQQAISAANNQTLIASGFFNGYSLYLPTTNQAGWTKGVPQEFIGAAQAPEPSSFVLLGSGLVGAAGMLRRRLARA